MYTAEYSQPRKKHRHTPLSGIGWRTRIGHHGAMQAALIVFRKIRDAIQNDHRR
jgi:hypothetical protein